MLILIPMQHSNSYTVCPGLHWLQGANTANDFSHAPAAFSIMTLRQLGGGGRGSEEFEPVPDFFFLNNGVTKRMPCVLIFIHTFLMNFFFSFSQSMDKEDTKSKAAHRGYGKKCGCYACWHVWIMFPVFVLPQFYSHTNLITLHQL